ncbi:hypothetical protein CONPUDRAFT_117787 [Coniophora puteana RWD-64-598 SS2]|uniref:F-box domain-containing protein n=1 Tax=Coniophora puteana (strain RWD-64-598) TaxID=741705 RepID=A0A5M3N1J1_CONPW|nr:uncharacterized protein CONPUDRAFT_117787 [Coniophora puteana RWD-64-598 SS2]EIW85176.1 hypothetical protein CONPUDRAFT_117787 [Coniophora puteana RWD-64-598 SS2]
MIAPNFSELTSGCVEQACRSSLFDLPSELIIEVLRNVDHCTILRCCSVCHRLKHIIDDALELQYIIELALDGMVDGPPSTLSPGERLLLLRRRRRAWHFLEWSKQHIVPMPGSCQAYELVGGVFAKTASTDFIVAGSRHFMATWLPSTGTGVAAGDEGPRTLTRDDIGITTRDFAIDPSQDLIVFVKSDELNFGMPDTLTLVLRAISTNEPHPEARLPTLTCSVQFPLNSAFIQIVDDVVGMLFYSEFERGPRIVIWNWHDGSILVDRSHYDLPHLTWDFSFLSSRAYIITCAAGPGSIEIFTFDAPNPSRVPVHVAKLQLPPLQPRVQVVGVTAHTGPFVARVPAGVPFAPNNDERLHVVSMQYRTQPQDMPGSMPRFCVVFKNSLPMEYIRKYREEKLQECATVLWHSWGPMKTRFLPQLAPFQWLRYVHGMRWVVPILPVAERGHRVQVLDFNVRNTRRQDFFATSSASGDGESGSRSAPAYSSHVAPASPSDCGSPSSCHGPPAMSPSELDNGVRSAGGARVTVHTNVDRVAESIFVTPVVSFLPYRLAEPTGMGPYSGVMIDEERLIGLEHPAFSNGDMKHIHVFTM